MECGYCGKKGHRAGDCYTLRDHEAKGRFQSYSAQSEDQWFRSREDAARNRFPDRVLRHSGPPEGTTTRGRTSTRTGLEFQSSGL